MAKPRHSIFTTTFAFLLLLFLIASPAQAKYGGGTGGPNDPYLIFDANQMNTIGLHEEDWDKHFKLMADINLAGYTGTSFNTIGVYLGYNDPGNNPFTGIFDGNGRTISNFTYISTGTHYIGLFGYVGGLIKDLGLIAPDVDAGTGVGVGSLVGYLKDGTITGCYVQGGSVAGQGIVGGLVGFNRGTITNCYSTGSALGDDYVGGLVGYNSGPITNCYSTGSVSGEWYVGGLVGDNDGTITNCYSTGTVSGSGAVGGLVGYNWGTITNCYATGSASGDWGGVGGLVGWNYFRATITNCYSTGSTSGEGYVGGLVGYNELGTVSTSFWDIETSGQTTSDGGTGLPTAEMQMQSTFTDAGWDFENIWWILEGAGYPRLWWEAKYGGGSGQPNNPYLIYTAEQMNTIGAFQPDWDKHFKLMADIDLSAYTGTSFNIIGTHLNSPFTGVFDGNGHTISNFTYTSAGTNYIGLFGYVTGVIKNLGLINPNVDAGTGTFIGSLVGWLREGIITNCYVEGGTVSSDWYVGGLMGYNDGTITNCYSTSSVSGDSCVGGLVGQNMGTISNCYSEGPVSGDDYVGGLTGYNYYGTITNCYATGSVTSGGGDSWFLGGLCGDNYNGTITNCYATGSVTSGGGDVAYLGGLCGINVGMINNCYATGQINGEDHSRSLGGLIGYNGYGAITNSYATGSVAGDRKVGGLVGDNRGTISNSYSEGDVSGDSLVGGLVGENLHGTITNCYAAASVSGNYGVGGLVGGNNWYGTITNCYVDGDSVSGNSSVGGLVGVNGGRIGSGTITNCYASGDVSGDWAVGGLVGDNHYGTITNCYSTTSVTGTTSVGGLVGYDEEEGVTVTSSFWDTETSGQTNSTGGTPKTTAEMQTASTFALVGWGCGSVWTIDEGNDYPRLVWENMPGEPITTPSYGGGSGEPNDPYLIYTAEQLNLIGLVTCDLDKHFKLMKDIDLAGYIGDAYNIIGNDRTRFTGVFDGKGHTISNFTHSSTYAYNIGLFGYVDDPNAEIKDVGLIDPNIDAGTGYSISIGSLAGYLENGAISNCYVEGGSIVGNEQVAGLVGYNSGKITDSYSTGSVAGETQVGGLVGSNRGTISNCYSTGSVTGTTAVGGLVGRNHNGTISNCYSSGSVTGTEYSVGGLVGANGGPITNCYATGGVEGHMYVGGFAGGNSGPITNCYSSGSVKGDRNVGGLVGDNGKGSIITNCYATGSVEGTGGDIGGLVGQNYWSVSASFWDIETSGQTTSAGGTGLPTDQMQMASTFIDAGWDFVGETVNGIEDIWFIPQQDYPHLWWEGMQVLMKLTPRKLNCRSKGNWVKAHLTLPEGFTVADVDSNRPAVLHSFGFESAPLYVFVNENELVEIEVAFEREAVCSLAGDWPETLTVAGFLTDGNIFLGTSKVRMITPGLKDIAELALYWLNADCNHPDFCDGIDMNRDSLVNLLDYALLLNCQVEFVSE